MAASMSFVDVYVWLGKTPDGEPATGLAGAKFGSDGQARCGHASMAIWDDAGRQHYVSFWPPANYIPSLGEDIVREGSLPDVVLRMHHLNVPAMLQRFEELKTRKLEWSFESPSVIKDKNRANCASFVYTLVTAGNAGSGNFYLQKRKDVRISVTEIHRYEELTKKKHAEIAGGVFDLAPWTKGYFTPKGLLTRIIAFSETVETDRKATTTMMRNLAEVGDQSLTQSIQQAQAIFWFMASQLEDPRAHPDMQRSFSEFEGRLATLRTDVPRRPYPAAPATSGASAGASNAQKGWGETCAVQ